MNNITKTASAFALVLSLVLLFSLSSFAQEKMTMEEYNAKMAEYQKRETDAKAELEKCQAEIESLNQQIAQVDEEIGNVWNEIYSLLETDEDGVKAFRSTLNDLEAQVDALASLSPEELFKRRAEIDQLEEILNGYKQSKIAKYKAILKDLEQAYWDYGVGGFSRKFRKELKVDPKKKIYGLFSTEDLIKEFSNAPSTPQDSKNQTNALLHFNVVEELPTIKNETLIITASHDKTLPKSKSELIHEKIPNSKLIVLEGVGHGSCLEKAPEINKLILEFLEN